MSRPRLLVSGASGLLGAAVMRLARDTHDTLGTYHTRPCPNAVALDLTNADAVQRLVAEFKPQAVIHTAYDKGRADVIADGSAHIARAAAAHSARLVHLSTDIVFDGNQGAYREDDPAVPVMPYGEAKLAAERAVMAACPHAVLVRTSLIYALDGSDHVSRAILDGVASGQPARLFTDEWRSPVFVDELAAALIELAAIDVRGPLHVTGPERISRYSFGALLASHYNLPHGAIVAATIADSGMVRPRDCSLDTRRAQALLRTRLRGPSEVLAR